MDNTATVIILLGFMTLLLGYILQKRNKHKPCKLPNGPTGLPLLGNVFGMVVNPHLKLSKWAEKYGPLYTIYLGNQPTLVISDAKLAKELFSKFASAGKFKTESMLLVSRGPNGILNTEGKTAAELRSFYLKSLKLTYTSKEIENMMMEEVGKAIKVFSSEVVEKTRIIPYKTIHRSVASFLYALVSGNKFEREQGQDDENEESREMLIKLLDNFLNWLQYSVKSGLCFAPWLRHVSPKWSGFVDFDQACAAFHSHFESVFAQKKENFVAGSAPRQLIDCYLQKLENMKDDKESCFYGEWGVTNSVVSIAELFIAGVNTISITMDWLLLHLSWNLDAQRKLQEEIDEVIGTEREPSLNDRSRMPYTEAVILEGHRSSSVIPLGVIHELLEDVEFHGFSLPRKLKLIANAYHCHNDKCIWGDPEKFRPERFLESEYGDATLKENVIPFQTGRRVCPGEPLAQDMIFLMITSFFQKFNVKPDPSISKEGYFKAEVGFALTPPQLGIIMGKRCV